MANPYADYYVNQAGMGIPGYAGARYQRGKGFFTKLLPGVVYPLLKYLGKTALSTGYDIAKDAAEGTNLSSSVKRRLTETGLNVAEAGVKRARRYAQTGKGKRRRRLGRRVKLLIKKTKKVKRRRQKRRRKVNKKRLKTNFTF